MPRARPAHGDTHPCVGELQLIGAQVEDRLEALEELDGQQRGQVLGDHGELCHRGDAAEADGHHGEPKHVSLAANSARRRRGAPQAQRPQPLS
eukprot:1489475-Lingulodinium_polyedra.AAC.1